VEPGPGEGALPVLQDWRKIQQEAQAAMQAPALPERIDKCEAFLSKYPDHDDLEALLEALIAAYVDAGDYDRIRVGALAEQLAGVRTGVRETFGLVRDQHLKHGLPLDSARRVAGLVQERLERATEEIVHEPAFKQASLRRSLARYAWQLSTIEGHLLLREGKPGEALALFRRAERSAGATEPRVVATDARGKIVRGFGSGSTDELRLGLAAALARTGDKTTARRHLDRLLGFLHDEHMKDLLDELRRELGAPAPGDPVTAPPSPAQAFALKDLDGKEHRLADLKGKIVLVAFFSTWCGPCKKELPLLQRFWKLHRDKGVELLSISIDMYEDRSKLKPFMQEHGYDFPVLLEQPEQLTAYNYRGVPALYVIDRLGRVASARTGYNPDLKEKLEREILGLVRGAETPGRKLITVEQSPPGFGLLWKKAIQGDAHAITIGAPLGSHPGEIALKGRAGLVRYSAAGEELGTRALTAGWITGLQAADLDGDGEREWVANSGTSAQVLDNQGESYWTHKAKAYPLKMGPPADLDGDGHKELLLWLPKELTTLGHVPRRLWTARGFENLQTVYPDPLGGVLVQDAERIYRLDAAGRISAAPVVVPPGRVLVGRVAETGGDLYVFQSVTWYRDWSWTDPVWLDQDVDGDGEPDVIISTGMGLVAYRLDGTPILKIRSHDKRMVAAVGELDGTPGAEVALYIEHYGLVALGRAADGTDR
jgi:peroxiredoxin